MIRIIHTEPADAYAGWHALTLTKFVHIRWMTNALETAHHARTIGHES